MLSDTAASFTITLPDTLTMRNISSVRDDLLQAIQEQDNVIVQLPADAQADLSFLQLMESARIYAGTAGKRLGLERPVEGRLLDLLKRAGFAEDMSAGDAGFWLHQGEIQ
jgi:STAS domain